MSVPWHHKAGAWAWTSATATPGEPNILTPELVRRNSDNGTSTCMASRLPAQPQASTPPWQRAGSVGTWSYEAWIELLESGSISVTGDSMFCFNW